MKTVFRIICLFLILLTTHALAEITIDGETVHVETDAYQVQFDRGVITRLHNKLTGETYTLDAGNLRARTGILGINTVLWTYEVRKIEIQKVSPHQVEMLFRKRGNEIRLRVGIDPDTGDLLLGGDCISDASGVYGFQWGIGNLDLNNLNLILPSKGGQMIDAAAAIKHNDYPYPSDRWEAQLAIIQAELGGFYLRGTDTTFQFKRLDYQSDTDSFRLGFQTHNQAPWDGLTSAGSVTWRLNTYAGDWCVPAQVHRDWMEETFDPWRLSDMPAWVGDIGLVAIHTSLDIETVEWLAEYVDTAKTLLYLTGWRDYEHDINDPDHTPHEKLGDFLEVVRRLGYRVMLHVNVHSCSLSHPLYPEFKKFQLRRPSGKLAGSKDHAQISLASSKWRNLLIQRWKMLWEEYDFDAFHLDTSHLTINNGNGLVEGLNSGQASVLMHKELVAAMPGAVFGGEGLHEATFFRESFAQRGIEPNPHPISAFLFSPYTFPYGNLSFPNPDNAPVSYHNHLSANEGRGVLPTATVHSAVVLNSYFAQQMLAVARQWQDLGLKPDFSCDWGLDTLFQYTTQTGETVTYQRTDSGSTLSLPGDGGYERTFGTTQVRTDRNLHHWRAYNDTHLIGLDPNRAYFLFSAPRETSQLHINSLSPDVYISETRVTDQAALFRLESTASHQQTTVGFFLPTAPVANIPDTLRHIGSGQYTLETDLSQPVIIYLEPFQSVSLPYNLKDAQFNAGFQFNGIFQLGSAYGWGRRTRETIDNIRKETIYGHPPRGAQTVIQFPLSLPQEPATFSFSMGLVEGCSKGVIFQVRINGQTHLETFTDTFGWKEGNISLSAFAGQPLLLELITDANGSNSCDWAHWADLHITAAPNPDANLDGRINILDLILVASSFGEQPPSNSQVDTNKDGVVNLLDLVFVAEHLSQNAAAPAQLDLIKSIPSTAKEIIAAQRALTELEAIPNKSQGVQLAIQLLRHYLSIANQRVQETKLLPNYPNPFNPETWIPYQLSESADVTVKIYDVRGHLARTIGVGHKSVGYYLTRERAVYWDGRNEKGERISSGVYFYTLTAGEHTQTRRLVIVK